MIGFIGLGNMGKHMANNLAKRMNVIVYDKKKINSFNGEIARDLSEIAEKANTIITMLPNDEIIRDVYSKLEPKLTNHIVIDSSTASPNLSKELANRLKCGFIDAPVSGGIQGAFQGNLTFMVGGSIENLERCREYLETMGKIIHCGSDVGSGQAAKICNNLLLAVTMTGLSESLNLGQKLGLNLEILSKVINQSSGRCWSSEHYNPVPGIQSNSPASNGYKGGFQSQLMLKDLGLGIACGAGGLAIETNRIYKEMCQNGYEEKDFSSIFQYIKNKT